MPLPSIRQLEYFISTARAGTFAGAAAEHHIAQPSVSEQIGKLERLLGVTLFTRTPRGLALTDVGAQVLELAEEAVGGVKQFAESGRRLGSVEAGRLSFGTFSSAHLYLLTDLIRDFRALHPHVRVRVTGLNSSGVADAVRAGNLEAGLVQLPIDDHDLEVSASVFTDQVVYVSADPLPHPGPLDLADVLDRPLVLSESSWTKTDPLRMALRDRAQQRGLRIEPVIEVELQTHALQLAAEGLGDTLVSYHVGREFIAQHGLHWAPLDPPHLDHYALITRRGGAISPATSEFMGMARALMDELARASMPPGG